MKTIAEYMADFEGQAAHWAYQNDWATIAQVKRADELYPQVVELLNEQDLLEEAGSPQRVYDYCFNDNLDTSAQDVVDELTA